MIIASAIIIPWQIFFRLWDQIDLSFSLFMLCVGFAVTVIETGSITVFFKLRSPVSGYALMLIAITAASLFRAPDNLYEAANVVGHLGVGMLVILWMELLLNSSNKKFPLKKEKVIKAFLVSAFPLGVVGVVLYFNPHLEEPWVKLVSDLLIEPDSATTRNNIQAIDKIGIVFMNTNAGAIFWGLSMWLALWLRQLSTGIWRIAFTIFAVIFCICVLGAGSRAGMLALAFTMIVPFILLVLYYNRNSWLNRGALTNAAIIIITVGSVLFIEQYGSKLSPSLSIIMRSQAQVDKNELGGIRLKLWAHSFSIIKQAPLLGHGVKKFVKLGFLKGFPPHNIPLQAWVYGGIIAMIGLIWLFGIVFYKLFRQLRHNPDTWLPIVLLIWVVIQAMFTNLFIGDFRIAILLWMVVSLFLWAPDQTNNEEAS